MATFSFTMSASLKAQIEPRTGTPDTRGGKTGSSGTQNAGQADAQDDGFGACPAFSHYHDKWENVEEWQKKEFRESVKVYPLQDGLSLEEFFDGGCWSDDYDKPILDIHEPLPNPEWSWL